VANSPSTVLVFEQRATPALRPFVDRFLIVEFPLHHRDAHLPDPRPVAAFSFRGRVRIDDGWAPPASFTGLRETVRAHEHSHQHEVMLVMFTPAGAAAFLRPPLEEFVGITTDLEGLLGCRTELDRLSDQLASAENHESRITEMEAFLLPRLRLAEPDRLIAAAIRWLTHGTGTKRIDELTRYIGLSQSALERRFRRVVGVSPKRFASIVRLHRAARLRAAGADFTSVAQAAGYFDQAHFIHDFRRATGSSPEVFFRAATSA
jgi:AraC-like DNA-binding protein